LQAADLCLSGKNLATGQERTGFANLMREYLQKYTDLTGRKVDPYPLIKETPSTSL
jgi:hypothetical protein